MVNYKKFLDTIKKNRSPIVLWAVPSDNFLHPCATDLSAVFIKNIDIKETYCLGFNHPDLPVVTDKVIFAKDLNELDNKWVFDKKSFIQFLPVKCLFDINLYSHLQEGKIIEQQTFETPAHRFIYRSKRESGDLNKVVPILKHKETFEKICDEFLKIDISSSEEDYGYQRENEYIIESLADLESNGIYVNAECFNKHFDAKVNPNGLVYSQYNVYTSTGRPSNHFDNVNYAALNKDDGVRSCFVSRYGDKGFMMLVDYSAFHPRIICNLVNFPLSIDEDIYKYLGEMYLKRKVTEYDMEEIKSVTMRQLYGGVEEKYEGIKYFASLKEFMNDNWNFFKNNGYVLTPMFKRKITDKHLHDPNPAKLFNYILQATESEVAISALRWINNYLIGKKTKAVLYTYDSILFDFYKPDGHEVVGNIMELMMVAKKFPIKVYMGLSYNSVSQIYP
jgi:hypothetical protein